MVFWIDLAIGGVVSISSLAQCEVMIHVLRGRRRGKGPFIKRPGRQDQMRAKGPCVEQGQKEAGSM